jgi:hypothetical protein
MLNDTHSTAEERASYDALSNELRSLFAQQAAITARKRLISERVRQRQRRAASKRSATP